MRFSTILYVSKAIVVSGRFVNCPWKFVLTSVRASVLFFCIFNKYSFIMVFILKPFHISHTFSAQMLQTILGITHKELSNLREAELCKIFYKRFEIKCVTNQPVSWNEGNGRV
jgi:hypothetical protein